MKNSLQLQITTIIKKANQHYTKREYNQSANLYDRALQIYHENRSYNSQVSPHFQAVIYSLKGLALLSLKQYETSQNMFNQSLKINPFDSLTLIRRANLYLQVNRLSESIQDAENAYICDPDGKSLEVLIDSLKNSIQQLEDENQKIRLRQNLSSIINSVENIDEIQLDQQETLNFCHLKKIDRVSFTSSNLRSGKNITQFQNQYYLKKKKNYTESQCLQFQNQVEAMPVSIIQKNKTKKNQGYQRSLWKCLSINLCQENQANNKAMANGENLSIKSIDNKLERRTSVKFLDNTDLAGSQKISEIQSLPNKQSPVQRKSCLRSSKLCAAQEQIKQQCNTHRRTSSFMQIKNIDGSFISSNVVHPNQMRQNTFTKQQSHEETIQKQMSESDDDENKQHNIFGDKYGTGKILKCLQNLNNWSGKNIQKLGKKDSILKKNSLIGSQRQTKTSGKLEHKKSVCFLEQS